MAGLSLWVGRKRMLSASERRWGSESERVGCVLVLAPASLAGAFACSAFTEPENKGFGLRKTDAFAACRGVSPWYIVKPNVIWN